MDLKKQLEFFNPNDHSNEEIHIIGVGAIGSHLVEMLVRMGFEDIHIYDFDEVTPHNLANQMYYSDQVGQTKLNSISETKDFINPACTLRLHPSGWVPGTRLSGHVFLAVDDIDLRRAIFEENKNNVNLVTLSDYRMGLMDAQHYFACARNDKDKIKFESTMQFSHEEAKASTPISACGTSLNVIPTVRLITALGIANWMNFCKGEKHRTMISMNTFNLDITSF